MILSRAPGYPAGGVAADTEGLARAKGPSAGPSSSCSAAITSSINWMLAPPLASM
jgi:hypothetical protein